MPKLDMEGPFDFKSAVIDQVVTQTAPGNYALGRISETDGKTFIVGYVGRSDTDLNKELKARLGYGYPAFKCSYATSPRDAFLKECRNYHDFGGSDSLKNDIHPARPGGTTWKCPTPGCTAFEE